MESVRDSGSSSGTNLSEKSARSGERGIALTLSPLTGACRRSFNSTIFFRAISVMVIMGSEGNDLPVSGCPGVCSQTGDSERWGRVGDRGCIRWMVDVRLFLLGRLAPSSARVMVLVLVM